MSDNPESLTTGRQCSSEVKRAVMAYRAMAEAAMQYVPLTQRDRARDAMLAVAMGVLHGTTGE